MTKSQIKLILGHLNLFGHVTVGELSVFTLAQLNHFFWYLKRNFEERNSPEAFNSGWEKEEVPSAVGNDSLCLTALIQSHSPRLQQLTQTLSCFLSSQPPTPLPPPREAKKQTNSSGQPPAHHPSPALCNIAANQQHFSWMTVQI